MAGERRLRILELLTARTTDGGSTPLCEVCAEATGATGAGIMLMTDDLPQGSACTSDAVSARIEELQYALGEGPCVDAHRHGRPVLEPDLADPVEPRWLAFTGPVLEMGARAVFGFPLQVGAVRLGALNLYRDRAEPLSVENFADALVAADIAAEAVLAMQAGAPPGGLAVELESGSNLHLVVHQAAGMVSAQLGVGVTEALVRLRATAFGTDRPLTDVARQVVNRELRFNPEDHEPSP